jgi:hypothetical protein
MTEWMNPTILFAAVRNCSLYPLANWLAKPIITFSWHATKMVKAGKCIDETMPHMVYETL